MRGGCDLMGILGRVIGACSRGGLEDNAEPHGTAPHPDLTVNLEAQVFAKSCISERSSRSASRLDDHHSNPDQSKDSIKDFSQQAASRRGWVVSILLSLPPLTSLSSFPLSFQDLMLLFPLTSTPRDSVMVDTKCAESLRHGGSPPQTVKENGGTGLFPS